jgi:uncharacterized protein (UPF0335 family)
MNDNEGTLSEQIARLESLVEKMREDLKHAQEELKGRPLDARLRTQLVAIRELINAALGQIDRIHRGE